MISKILSFKKKDMTRVGQVVIEHGNFCPKIMSAKVGQIITFINNDSTAHNITSSQFLFLSPDLKPGERFQIKFTHVGKFPYFCALTPSMEGEIEVRS